MPKPRTINYKHKDLNVNASKISTKYIFSKKTKVEADSVPAIFVKYNHIAKTISTETAKSHKLFCFVNSEPQMVEDIAGLLLAASKMANQEFDA